MLTAPPLQVSFTIILNDSQGIYECFAGSSGSANQPQANSNLVNDRTASKPKQAKKRRTEGPSANVANAKGPQTSGKGKQKARSTADEPDIEENSHHDSTPSNAQNTPKAVEIIRGDVTMPGSAVYPFADDEDPVLILLSWNTDSLCESITYSTHRIAID